MCAVLMIVVFETCEIHSIRFEILLRFDCVHVPPKKENPAIAGLETSFLTINVKGQFIVQIYLCSEICNYTFNN